MHSSDSDIKGLLGELLLNDWLDDWDEVWEAGLSHGNQAHLADLGGLDGFQERLGFLKGHGVTEHLGGLLGSGLCRKNKKQDYDGLKKVISLSGIFS